MRAGNVAGLFGIFAVAALAATLSGCVVGTSQAGCAAPMPSLEAGPRYVETGQSFTLRGEGFIGRFVCDDTGPGFPEQDDTGAYPARDIRLEYRQDGNTWKLDTVDAGPKLGFETLVEVPDEARPGPATVRAFGGGKAKTTLRVIEEPAPKVSHQKPPSASLSFDGRTVQGEPGSFCSADGCMDIAGFPVPAKKDELAVLAGSRATLELEKLEPSSVEVGAAALDGEDARVVGTGGFRSLAPRGGRIWPKTQTLETRRRDLIYLDLPPAGYALEVFVRFPQGDATHYFRVKVEPESKRNLAVG